MNFFSAEFIGSELSKTECISISQFTSMKFNKANFENVTKEEWDWFIGLFLADGSKFIRNRNYTIMVYLNPDKDEEILNKLLNILRTLELNYKVKLKRQLNTIFVYIGSKSLYNRLPSKKGDGQNYFPSITDAFIAGFLDGDGYIRPRDYSIGFSQTTVKWIGPFIEKHLSKRGVRTWFRYYGNAYYLRAPIRQVEDKTDIFKFAAKVKV